MRTAASLLATLGVLLAVACAAPAAPASKPAAATAAPASAPAAPAATQSAAATAAAGPQSAANSAQTAPAPAKPAGPPTVLKLTDLRITSQAGYYIAQFKGYFAEEGIQLEFVPTNAADLLPLLVSGQAELGGGAISSGLYNAFARGIPAKIVADAGRSLDRASAGGIVYRRDLYDNGTLRGAADLRGRKVSISTQASAPDIALDRFMNTVGLTIADVETVLLPLPDTLPAFENRAVEAGYFQEPFTTLGVERGMIVRGPIAYDFYPDQQIGVTLFGERLLGDRPLANRYMRAYVRGVRDYVRAMIDRDPAAFDDIVPILIEYTTVKERALYERAIPSGLTPDALPNLQSLAADQEWYLAHGYQPQRININDFVDTSFVEQAVRDLGPYRR